MRAFLLLALPCIVYGFDIARPDAKDAVQLSSSPPIWLARDFLSATTVQRIRSLIPTNESAYVPCIGQVEDFEYKKCTWVPVAGDAVLEAAVTKIGTAWNMDATLLMQGGLPIIRYLPGSPAVGKHGDEDRRGIVPNTTLVIYLGSGDGQTIFPEADVTVTPERGAVLSFQNVDEAGAAHPNGKHLVSAVPKDAVGDRLVVQIPIAHRGGAVYAFADHVSGKKKPGEHPATHGKNGGKEASLVALALGWGIAVAYMAAQKAEQLEEKWTEETFPTDQVKAFAMEAEATGKFEPDDFKGTNQLDPRVDNLNPPGAGKCRPCATGKCAVM